MKIAIVGLGLIGGSLGIDLRSRSGVARSQGHEIIGISRQASTCQIALETGVVDKAGTNFELIKDSEIVIICTPIESISSTLSKIVPYLTPDTIVTDVGSVKEPVVIACSSLWSNFVGGHPMAGTAESGIGAAQANLFQGAAYVFTPTPQTNSASVDKLSELALSLGAIPHVCTPAIHDRAVSLISHLPVMISASLIATCLSAESDSLDLAQKLASSGFRDTSRVGGGNPELGIMMAKYNRQELLNSLNLYRQNLEGIIESIEREDWHNLAGILETNRIGRPKFLK
jgi:arogenate dehydrogenase (NADP+)